VTRSDSVVAANKFGSAARSVREKPGNRNDTTRVNVQMKLREWRDIVLVPDADSRPSSIQYFER
jgi:hypothetical protein